MITAPVNNIIKSSVVDGPGNRCAIFLQGCNMHCWYCHNPETINMCSHCGKCVENCPVQALEYCEGKVVWQRKDVLNVIHASESALKTLLRALNICQPGK
ncbi:MAG: 4Fe-4S cluster-binding domain-containing protein [Erysipelotrichaceae bacterium]|nr:4Fe-4S cluster-binding domain-containing protein [Erysipelotrichaceae bacterium]